MRKFAGRLLRHWFLPQKSNNYRALVLQPQGLAVLVGVFLTLQTSLALLSLARPGVLGYTSQITPEKIIELTNYYRQAHNLPPLQVNEKLNEAARRKAADMFLSDYWSHTSPTGRTPWDFLKEVDYRYKVAGENLAKDFANPEAVLRAWMRSPSHRTNILDSRFKEIGVAVAEGTLRGVHTTLVVQFFGAPSGSQKQIYVSAYKPVQAASDQATPLSKEKLSSRPLVNPLQATKWTAVGCLGLVGSALVIDSWLVSKKRIWRLVGENSVHLTIVVILLMLVVTAQQGAIN